MELSAALRTGGQEWMAATARITCELPWETERLCESPAGTRVPPGTSQTLSCTTTFRAFMQRSTTKDTTFCLNLSVIWGVTGGQVETSTLDSYLCMLTVVMQTEQGLVGRYQNRNNSSCKNYGMKVFVQKIGSEIFLMPIFFCLKKWQLRQGIYNTK